jgi:hypothetical protein
LGAIALAIALVLVGQALNLTARRTRPGALAPLWDVAAISVRSGELFLPAELLRDRSATPDLANLERHFSPWSVGRLIYFGDGYASLPRNEEESTILMRAWRDAVTSHPVEYLRHRGFVFLRLLAIDPMAEAYFWERPPRSPDVDRRCGVPPPRPAAAAAKEAIGRWFHAATRTPLYRTWLWALASLALLLGAPALARSLGAANGRAIGAIAASGLLYVAPLAVIAPGVEFRYTLWLYPATAIASALAISVFARGRSDRARADSPAPRSGR